MSTTIVSFLLTIVILTGCSSDKPTTYQGYIEGEYVNIASSQNGRLDKLFVKRGEHVKRDSPLFILDSANEAALLRQSESELSSAQAVYHDMQKGSRNEELDVIKAKLTQAQANATNYQAQLIRNQELYKSNAVSKEALDNSTAAAKQSAAAVMELQNTLKVAQLSGRKDLLKAQKGKIDQIQALITQASWRLGEKALKSPTDAMVFDTLYREGEFVPVGGIVARLLPPQNRKVRFFVPQDIAENLKIGQKVFFQKMNITQTVPGIIAYISPEAEYTPPLIYSNESKDRLVFMVEAYPSLENAPQFHPGQPMQVSINEPAR